MEELFTKENCCRSMLDQCVETNQGCIAIINPEVLSEEQRTKGFQLVELLSGLGCKPHSFSDECYVRLCSTRRKTYIKRTALLGITDEATEEYAFKLMDPFTDDEKKILNNGIDKIYKMYDELHQYFHDDSSKSLRDKFYSLKAKIAGGYYNYSSLECSNLNIALLNSDLVEVKKSQVGKGLDPKTDPECILLNGLHSKIFKLTEEEL